VFIYLSILSVNPVIPLTTNSRMTGRIANSELDRMCKESIICGLTGVPNLNLRAEDAIFLKTLCRGSQCLDRDSNWAPTEYTSEAIQPELSCLENKYIYMKRYSGVKREKKFHD
jgi:hypothetical protein